MKVVYVAGPYRAPTWWEICRNIRSAESLALDVASLGAMPLCPHMNTANFHGLLTDGFWLEGTRELLRRADAVILAPRWQSSEGAIGEIEEANRLGLPVLHRLGDLVAWLRAEGEAVAPTRVAAP